MCVRLSFIFLLLALCACEKGGVLGPGNESQLASAAQADCGFVQNVYGERVSWKKNIPILLRIHKNYPAEFIDALKSATHHWDEAAGMTLFRLEEDADLATEKPAKDSANTIHWMTEWPESSKNQQGVTNLFWTGNVLNEADIAIDNKYFNFFISTTNTPYDVHLESLLVHELGHVLGLKHRNTVPSVMWSVLNGAVVRNVLTASDRETLKCEY